MAKRNQEIEKGLLAAVLQEDGSILLMQDGKKANVDFKSAGGDERTLIRRYSELSLSPFSSWSSWSASGGTRPSASFLRLASSMGRLYDWNKQPVSCREGLYQLELRAHAEGEFASFTLRLCGEDEPVRLFLDTLVLAGSVLYETGGGYGDIEGLKELEKEKISVKNLPLYLSILASRHDALLLALEGYHTVDRKPVRAMPALVFKEIDEYGYLHVLPDTHVDGFPAGAIDENGIFRSVSINEDAKTLEIRDIIFPQDAVEMFRKLLGKGAKNSVYEENGHFILDGDYAQSFIEANFQTLASSFALYHAEVLSKYKVRYVRPRVHFSFSSGIDFLEGEGSVDIDGWSMSLDDFLSSYRKNGGYVLMNDKSRAYIEASFIRRLERIAHTKNGKTVVSPYDLPFLDTQDDIETSGEALDSYRSFYRGFNGIKDQAYSTAIKVSSLRGYQIDGYKWLRYLHDTKMGGCLADEMGLGKTVQIIALLNDVLAKEKDKPSLIIAPKSIIYNWLGEIGKFGIKLKCFVYYGQERDAEKVRSMKGGIVISTYAIIRNDIEKFADIQFNYVILDESQAVKHFNTRTAQAVLNLKSEHRIAVSGTPIENDLGELYSLFRFLNPALFPSLSAFERDYVKPIAVDGDKDATTELRMKIYPFVMRRLKRDVLKDLPDKTEQTTFIDMVGEHWDYYEERRKEMKARIDGKLKSEGREKSSLIILQALTELRQIATLPEGKMPTAAISAKREYLREVLPEITGAGHKVLIFTSFLDPVEKIGEDLDELGIGYVVMTGSTRDRESVVSRFQSDPQTKVFLMTLKTGGVGLNLTAADYVFIFDPWWNAAAEDQAINRTHRIGQSNPVFCYRLIAKGTIEEKILLLQEKKRELSTSLITSDGAALKSLSDEEISELLG